MRSANAEDAAYARFDQGALPQAISIAKIGHQRDPLSLDPLFDLALFEQASGNNQAAGDALEKAVQLEPANPEPWRRLGEFRLNVSNAMEYYLLALLNQDYGQVCEQQAQIIEGLLKQSGLKEEDRFRLTSTMESSRVTPRSN